jgi:hypothetical protein
MKEKFKRVVKYEYDTILVDATFSSLEIPFAHIFFQLEHCM